MNRDVLNLVKDSASTLSDIAQMTQYRVKYFQKKDEEDKAKMYEHAFFAVSGIVGLFMIGIVGLTESRNS